jgi:hypothetical protein
LPLAEDALADDAPEDALADDAPADALVDDELDDEHAAVRPSSITAAAPAVGTDKDRFIYLLLRVNLELGCRSPDGAGRARMSVRGLACLHPADWHVQLLATSRKHMA